MSQPDDARLEHLVEAAQKAVDYAAVRTRADLDDDELLMAAWLAELDAEGDWIELPVTAAELLAEERADSRP